MFTVALGIVILMIAIMLDSDHFRFVLKPEYQVVIGTIVIAIVLFDNALSGLLVGLAVIVMYTRVQARRYGVNLDIMSIFDKNSQNNLVPGDAMRDLVKESPYISPANLLDAQNNIVDEKTYTTPYVGIPKTKGFPVYTAEGTDKEDEVSGYEGKDIGSAVKR
jgi:hypothetical protein